MKKELQRRAISIVVVTILFIAAIIVAKQLSKKDYSSKFYVINELQNKYGVDVFDEEQTEILKLVLDAYPSEDLTKEKFEKLLEEYKSYFFTNPTAKEGYVGKSLSFEYAADILIMYAKFIGIYFVSIFALYYLSKGFGFAKLIREINYQNKFSSLAALEEDEFVQKAKIEIFKSYVKNLLAIPFYLFIFSPSYVAAYAVRSKFDSDSFPFLIFFALFTNGILLYSSNKFYNLLKAEYHKGYALTAKVKNLKDDYFDFNFLWIFNLRKKLEGTVLGAIYPAAQLNFYLSLKEIGTFLITSLAIIEMALNIQNYLCYELLKTLLFEYYDSALFIIYLLFLIVKANDIAAELLYYLNNLKYES